MNSLTLVNYFEKQAKVSSRLRELMARATQCLLRKEEQRNLETALLQETLTATMDVYELEGILEQLKLQCQQKCATQERMHANYKLAVEFCLQVRNIDWVAQLHCKLELMQLQCQNEMRELSEEYDAEWQRRSALEQRPMVQKARMAEDDVRKIQAKIDDARERTAAQQAILLKQQKEMQNELHAIIVCIVGRSKQIADLETELETMKNTDDNHIKKLVTQKQELRSKLQKLNKMLPDSTTINDLELSQEHALPKMDMPPTTTKLEALLSLGNVNNATVCDKRREISFMELFKEWETKRQLQFQQLTASTAKVFTENAPNIMDKTWTSLEANDLSVAGNDVSKITPQSILRRPSVKEDEDNSPVIPKKRVRFATPEMVTNENSFMSSTTSRAIEGVSCFDEKKKEGRNHTFVIEQNNSSFNGATETIEILSTGEIEELEQTRKDELTKQKQKKPEFIKANKLVKKARLFDSQRLNKTQKIKTTAGEKQKIQIQECRIIKPAGTKLPTKLPITLTPEPQAPTANQPISSDTLQVATNQTFKSPLKPTKRKSRKMPDCDTFFREFLKQSHEENSQKSTGIDYKATTGTIDPIIAAEPLQASEKYKSKSQRKKTEMDFDSFFRETLMSSNESSDGLAAAMHKASKGGNFLQFNMKFDENQGLLGDSVNDFFAGQANNDKDDDMFSLDFSDENNEENGKTDMFL